MARKKRLHNEPIIIKKYANRRLYNTETSSYVTLDHLAAMIKQGGEFVVLDAQSGNDLTRSVLAQIIFEKETKEENLLPLEFLQQLIRFYGDNMQELIPTYLQSAMDILKKHQDQIKIIFGNSGNENMMPLFEEMTRQNIAFFDQTMQMFMDSSAAGETSNTCSNSKATENDEIAELQAELAALKEKVDTLTN